MDKACISKKIQIGIYRELYKKNLLTKAQLTKAIEIASKKRGEKQ